MQSSDHERAAPKLPAGCDLAIAAEAFYITNMVLAPGLGFIMLAFLYPYCLRRKAPAIAMDHLRQAMWATLWTGVLAIIFLGLIFVTGGYPSPWFWPLLTVYFLGIHLPLSWLGVVGLGRALSGESYRYPLIGPRLAQERLATAQ